METLSAPLLEEEPNVTTADASSFSGLDPILASLGVLAGLLEKNEDGSHSLISEWFTDPFSRTKAGIVKNPTEFSSLFESLLGKVGGNAFGIPVQNPAILGTWYPIKYEKDGKDVDTGVYAVTYQTGSSTVIGVGVYHAWNFGSPAALQSSVWGLIPFVAIDAADQHNPVKITFCTEGFPIIFGASVNGPVPSDPLININGIQFNGVKVNATIDLAKELAGKSPFELGVEIAGLQLAGEKTPSNRSLSDLEAITAGQILDTATSLFVGGLSKVFPDLQDNIQYFPPLFGFSSQVPKASGAPAATLPVLKWYDLFSAARSGNAEAVFLDWFKALAADANTLKTWLSCLSGFLLKEITVSGDGSRNAPFLITLLDVGPVGKLSLSMGTEVVEKSTRILYPGIAFSGSPIEFGTSGIIFTMEADAELAKFQITGAVGLSPAINFTTRFSLKNKTGGTPLAAFNLEDKAYSIGSLEGGLSLGLNAGLMPWFGLAAVNIGSTHYDTLNLLSPGQLANAGAAALSEGLQSLLDFGAGNEKLSTSIGVIIGLETPTDANWPRELVPPFSPTGMPAAITDPIGSWARYYTAILKHKAPVNSKAAFSYLVKSFADLLQASTDSLPVAISGSGTVQDPWKAGLSVKDLTLPAYLTCYQQDLSDTTTLNLGLELAPELTIHDTTIVASLALDAVAIQFSKDGVHGNTTADWFAGIAANLTLPKGFETPAVGGMQVKVDSSELSASWSQRDGWSWSMIVNGPALVVNGQTTALGTNLNFDDQSTLQDLVKQSEATFGPFLVSALGTMLMRTQSTTALFVAGALGLVKDISTSPVFPSSGLRWTGFELYPFTSFQDPWKDLNRQIDQLFHTEATGKSVLGLLAFALSDATSAPAITGCGTFAAPWITPIPFGFNLSVWYNASRQNLGLGFGRNDLFNYPGAGAIKKISFTLEQRLNLVEYSTKDHAIDYIDAVPSLDFIGTLSTPDGKLVDLGIIGNVEKVLLGLTLSLQTNKVKIQPVVSLVNVQLGTGFKSDLVTLAQFQSDTFALSLQTAFEALLNGALQAAARVADVHAETAANAGNGGFHTTYKLLQLLGLTLPRVNAGDPYGINASGWNALMADPGSYMEGQMESLLSDPARRKTLFDFLQQTTGITLPTLPEPALRFLSALGICGNAHQGYPLLPAAILEVFTNPVQGLTTRFKDFFTNAEAVKELAAQLASNLPPAQYSQFTFSTTANGAISFGILPKNAIDLGGFAALYGTVNLNIRDESLAFTANIYLPAVGLTLASSLAVRMDRGVLQEPVFTVQLVWGNGQKPASAPLTLYPFDAKTFVDQVAKLAPSYTLNILLNAIFEDKLLGQYAFIQKIFSGLGIGKDADGLWRMPSLLGILSDPLGWILSDEVLGTDGKFSIPKLVTLLGQLPMVQYNAIQVIPTPDKGVDVTGLPYGFKIGMNGGGSLAIFNVGVDAISIVDNLAALRNVTFSVSLDQNYQPAFSGGLDLEATIPSLATGFFAHVGYNKGFELSLSQGTPDKPDGPGVQLLPFQGWGTLAGQALATGAGFVIKDVVPRMMDHLLKRYPPESTDAGKFFAAMNDFADKTAVKDLVDAIIHTFSNGVQAGESGDVLLQKLETTAFDWVKKRFSKKSTPDTIQALAGLLTLALPKDSISVVGDRIQYTPSKNLPLRLLAGVDDSNSIGLWAGVDVPGIPLLKMEIAPTGAAYNPDTQQSEITFGLNLVVPIENSVGPGLHIRFYNGTLAFSFDPLANPAAISTRSALDVELLPHFFGTDGARVSDWVFKVIKDVLPRYISLLVLNQKQVKSWLHTPLIATSAISPALLLEVTQIVEQTDDVYVLRPCDELAKITPRAFLGNFLFALLNAPWTLLSFGEKGRIIIGPKTNAEGYYGLLIQAPDLTISAIPNLVLQLGGENNDWIKNSTSKASSFGDSGVGFYVPITNTGKDTYSADFTHFNLVLNNAGFDLIGKNGHPIVDFSRFKLGSAGPRALFDLKLGGDKIDITFGAGLTLGDMGLSLSPETIAEGGGNNPVARNVLGSGEKDSNSESTDPRFSVDIGYVDKLWVNLRSNTGNGHEVTFPVQQSFGPLYIENIGLGWEGEKNPPLLDFISTGTFELAGFKAALQGLRVAMPVTFPADWSKYTIDLDGFAVDYTGGVTINAGFLKAETDGIVNYTGTAILSVKSFSLGSLGSYAQTPVGNGSATSMFIFGVLNTPLGGIPAFFIEGIAAGFAYNWSLEIPGIEDVAEFPLVKGVAEGSFTQGEDPTKALLRLKDVIRPRVGQYWFAAGLKFSSFRLLDTTALLFLSFGKDFEFNLLGVSIASLPPRVSQDKALAYMELAIKVSFNPDAGYTSVEAQLTPNAFVLAREVKLTGGFAFCLWFKTIPLADGGSIPAGDFVVTLGGYHPAFHKPSYYPDVPRLGINWKLEFSSAQVSITGGAYFAICPTAIMAGGYLKIAFNAGPLIAGLDAYANFLIEWEPFYFYVGIGVTVFAGFDTTIAGVSVRLVAKLGCVLELQGPPVFGSVEVDWYIISFSIPIGNQHNHPDTASLDWSAFEESFLPAPPLAPQGNDRVLLAIDNDTDDKQQVVKWSALKGLEQDDNTDAAGTGSGQWVLNPIPWKVTVESAVPSSSMTVTGSNTSFLGSSQIGVRPMGKEDFLESPMVVTLADASGTAINLPARNIRLTTSTNGAPSALWSRSALGREVVPDPTTMIIPDVLFGLVIEADQYVHRGVVPAFPLENLAYVTGDTKRLAFDYTPQYPPAALYPVADQRKAFTRIKQTIMADAVVSIRNGIYKALEASAVPAPSDPDLHVMASSANLVLQDFPVLARIGIFQNNGVAEPGKSLRQNVASPPKQTPKPALLHEPYLAAQRQAYGILRHRAGTRGDLPTLARKAKGQWKTGGLLAREGYLASAADFSGTRAKKLYDGTTLVWKTDPAMHLDITLQGNLPSLITSFDEYGSLQSFDYRANTGTHALPSNTARVVIQGFETNPEDTLGWQINTPLSKLGHAWLQADGCLVRVQNNRQMHTLVESVGYVEAHDLIDGNLVKGSKGVTRKGWVQTVFPKQSQVYGVLMAGKVSADSIQVSVAADRVPTRAGKTKPASVEPYQENTLFLFDAPSGEAVAFYGIIVSAIDQKTGILGMYAQGPKPKKNALVNHLSLVQGGIDFNDLSPKTSSVKLTRKTTA